MSTTSRSLQVNPKYIANVSSALLDKNWTQANLAESLGLSRATISKFLNGKPIDRMNFLEISQKLNLDWEEISNFQESTNDLEDFDIVKDIEKSISKKYQIILQTKNQQIALLAQELEDKKKENIKLLEMIELMSRNSGNIYIHDSTLGDLNVSNSHHEKKYTNIYESQDLIKAAQEIQKLLEQLEQVYPFSNVEEKKTIAEEAIKRINSDISLSKRITNALKAGNTSALESLVEHPAAHLVIESLGNWQKNKQ